MVHVASSRPTSTTSGRIANPFSFFFPGTIKQSANGSITLDGNLNKSLYATIRYDAQKNGLFVTMKPFLKPQQPERPMTTGELQALSSTLTRYMHDTPGRQPIHEALNRKIRSALQTPAPAPTADVSKIPTSISANGASASVSPSFWVNLMPGAPRPNAIGAITISGTGFNDAPPTFKLSSLQVVERGTHKVVATLPSPKLQGTETHWGEKKQTYRVEVPKANLDLSKRYTFVATVSINNAPAQKVRSEYVPVDKVY